jgi:hypothetical protein
MTDADREAGDEADSERFTPYTEPTDREVRIDADDVEDAITAALASVLREFLEAEGEADAPAIFGGVEYDVLVEASELTVQGWIDDALVQLQADEEIEYVGRAGAFQPVADDGRDDADGDLWTVATKGPDEVEKFRRAADQTHRAERAMADVDLNAVAALSDRDVRQFLQAKQTIREIVHRARENQHSMESRHSSGTNAGGAGETVAGPGGEPQ